MKEVDVRVAVTLVVQFSEDEAASIISSAEHHYDYTCRTLPVLKLIAPGGDVSLNWHDLDILSKVCESPLASEKVQRSVWAAFKTLHALTDVVSVAIEAEVKK